MLTESTTTPTSDPVDVARQWRSLLPDTVRNRFTGTGEMVVAINTAVRRGWTVQQLATEAGRDLTTARNVGATITTRLRRAAELDPPAASTLATYRQPNPPCGNCDPVGRWVIADGPARRCECWTDPKGAS